MNGMRNETRFWILFFILMLGLTGYSIRALSARHQAAKACQKSCYPWGVYQLDHEESACLCRPAD